MAGIVLVFDLSFIYTASYLIFVSISTQCFHPGWKSLLLVLFMVTKFNILYEHTCNILNDVDMCKIVFCKMRELNTFSK